MSGDLITPRCNYCLLEQILSPEQRDRDILKKPIQESHPRMLIIEEVCLGGGVDCEMKAAVLRIPYTREAAKAWERMAYQLEVMNIFKLDQNRSQLGEISWQEIWRRWTDPKSKISYAKRFSEIWEYAQDRLTPMAAYEIIVSKNRTYKKALALSRMLAKEREQREKGIDYLVTSS